MRFDRLDILRYGALTDRKLDFRPDAKLHVIYGPNEAGKSSALLAISDLLFGFPTAIAMSFLHDAASLRVGADVTASDGRKLSFRRRRGRKNTLLASSEAEEALADDALSPFLGTLSREVFNRAFGLNSASLNQGGEEMLRSGGEIGSLLFSAASGLLGLSDLRKSLEAEADGIYGQRKSKDRSFYQALDAHEEARKAERDNELKSGDWKKLVAEQTSIERDLSELLAQREATKRALDRLRRLTRLEPVLREIDREREALTLFGHLADLPAGFAERVAEGLDRARINSEARAVAEREISQLKDRMAAIHVDDALVAAAPKIVAAHARIGAYLNAQEDIVRVRLEVEGFDDKLLQAARKLGLASASELARAQPAETDMVRLRDLIEKGTTFDRSLKQLRHRLEEERKAHAALVTDAARSRAVDPKPWADHIAALRPEIAELGSMETLKVRVTRAEADLKTALLRLDPPVKDMPRLLSSPLPSIETLMKHRSLIDQADAAHEKAGQKLVGLGDELKVIESQIEEIREQGKLVSREDILESRARRDLMIDDLATQPKAVDREKLKSAVDAADSLSDAALADAQRVARHAQLSLRQKQIAHSIGEAQHMAKEAAISASDARTEFEDLFHALPVSPAAPDRMIEWRREIDGLIVLESALNDASDAAEALRLREEDIKPALFALAEATGVSPGLLPLRGLVRDIDRRISELSERWSEGRSLDKLRKSAEDTLTRLEKEEKLLRAEIEAWQQEFLAAASPLGLSESATIEMASAAIEIWRTVPDIVYERENRDRRVRGMTRDMEAFEQDVASLCNEVSASHDGLPANIVMGMLNDNAAEARSALSHRASLLSTLKQLELDFSRAVLEAESIGNELAVLAQLASCEVETLSTMLKDFARHNELEASLDLCRQRFAEHSDGSDEETARADLSGFDRIAASLEIEKLEAEDNREIDRLKALGIAQADNARRRLELETGIGAEEAVFRKLAAEEEAKQLARRWVVTKLAATLLSNSMEAYRERQADPVMRRAGDVFANLTGGRFSRLVQLYDDQDELRLAVERNSGEQVPLSGLSEGTGDQLYLALRLAFLEDYCSRNEPAPLILDDIFQTFDDERTAAGIRTLAKAGDTFQTILFTHQTSLVETARRELGEALNVITLERA